jgi:hypothetical protein
VGKLVLIVQKTAGNALMNVIMESAAETNAIYYKAILAKTARKTAENAVATVIVDSYLREKIV